METFHARVRVVSGDDRGFGVIEIVISMFLLGLLATAFLPLLVQGLKQSASNATIATATQLASSQIELARSATKCTELTATSTTVVDSRNVSLLVARTIGPCAPVAENPVSVPVSVTVTRADTGNVLAKANTLVFIAVP